MKNIEYMRRIIPTEGNPYCIELVGLKAIENDFTRQDKESGAYETLKNGTLIIKDFSKLPSISEDPLRLGVAILTKASDLTGEELSLGRKLAGVKIRRVTNCN